MTDNIDGKYGEAPSRPEHLRVSVSEARDLTVPSGTVELMLEFHLEYPRSEACFTAHAVLPVCKRTPVIIAIGEWERLDDSTFLARELSPCGIGLLYIPAERVSSLRGGLRERADRAMLPSRRRKNTAGKLSLYAYAMSIAREYLSGLGYSRYAALGHGVTAEAALLAAARDREFALSVLDSPFLTSRSVPFLPKAFYSIGFALASHQPSVNLFKSLSPRGAVVGLSSRSVPDETEPILDMLSEAYGISASERTAFLMGERPEIVGRGYRVFGDCGITLPYIEVLLNYIDAISEYFQSAAEL